ncbi:MAG: prolyl oligopeptidase family serine peptidase [Oscillatoria sp. SIO1A7]|nr:prolyl oligopeptidase family serine peptidase [Oscillatoria sp. SIO1A7]
MPNAHKSVITLLLAIAIEGCRSPQQSDRIVNNYPSEPEPEYLLPKEQPSKAIDTMNLTNANPGWNKNLMADDVPYDLYIPGNYRDRSVLVLPGWNFSRTNWVENAPLVEYADRYGYALILPEMLQTVYASSYYPETNLRWNRLPGGQFIKEQFLPAIQKKHNLLKPGQHNTLLGLSTGGRGVALIALENPGLFVAGASLSGDFSQENMPSDNLMTALYGSFEQFPDRWKGRDNPQARAAEWIMPLYLAHGTADEVVPESQSRLFYEALIRDRGDLILVEYHPIAGAGHDYSFWGGQLPAVFEFFERHL